MQLALTNSNAVVYCVFPQPFSIQNGAASGHSVHVHIHTHMCVCTATLENQQVLPVPVVRPRLQSLDTEPPSWEAMTRYRYS